MRRLNARKLDRNSNIEETNNSESESKSKMESIKLQFRPNSPHRSSLFSRNPKHSTTNITKFFASIAITLALFCYIFVVSTAFRNSGKRKFGIVIDGGSTGTRIHVFEYVVKVGVANFDFGENGLASMRVNRGLSAYAEDTEGAGVSLGELVEFGKKRVPKEYWGETEIRLMATAGLRMLELSVQDRILESCRKFLRLSGFRFRDDWASVITGSDEGVYAWVVANYALGTLGGDPLKTTGIIELGGASAQVTFVSREPIPTEFSRMVKFGNISYNLYSHSLLQFGQNVAFDLLRESLVTRAPESATESLQTKKSIDPCTPSGYSHDAKSWTVSHSSMAEKSKYLSAVLPKGNFSECRSAALMLLQKGKEQCSYQHCYIGSTFIPKLQGKFLTTENFFYTSKFFGLAPRKFISGLMTAGQQFCEEDWPKLRMKYDSLEEDDLLRYCFSSAYIVALLHDSLGIALDDERIGFANQVGDIPLDWALGAFILQSADNLNTEHPNWIATVVSNDSSTLIALFAIFIVLIFSAWSFTKWRKPQVKTIYDLEKGKYIVTRVSR
ncbi:probable apyrase 6 [Camellia sinensis]|uniref:probable apyrase 6 n=1 Tax=Camellia sinensis TaxID=4442 RepID=UPI001036D2CD|nr:probable apyrase 6 [Camellia sinensis]